MLSAFEQGTMPNINLLIPFLGIYRRGLTLSPVGGRRQTHSAESALRCLAKRVILIFHSIYGLRILIAWYGKALTSSGSASASKSPRVPEATEG
eukprot:2361178-Pyramimonas_sp.AAC.1